jgi:hypothetical protein
MGADHGGSRHGAGRKPKAPIEQRANKGIASEVLAMDGPPLHRRKCKCDLCADHRRRRCRCLKVKDVALPLECEAFADHQVCHCEKCGWWQALTATDKRLRMDARKYLTDRRDGKPAQGVFIGDTRENAPDLDFGNLLMPAGPEDQSGTPGKPN